MAPLPPNSTARFWLDYTTNLQPHSAMFRAPNDATLAEVISTVDNYFTMLGPSLYLITVTGARYALEGTNVSNPVAWTGASTYGAGDQPPASVPIEVRFEGRSPLGRRTNWSFYGYKNTFPGSFRIFLDGDAGIAAAWSALEDAITAGILVAIDDGKPQLLPYANIQFNSYWETQQRR